MIESFGCIFLTTAQSQSYWIERDWVHQFSSIGTNSLHLTVHFRRFTLLSLLENKISTVWFCHPYSCPCWCSVTFTQPVLHIAYSCVKGKKSYQGWQPIPSVLASSWSTWRNSEHEAFTSPQPANPSNIQYKSIYYFSPSLAPLFRLALSSSRAI